VSRKIAAIAAATKRHEVLLRSSLFQDPL
jgi:hypothetical protein